MPIIRVEMYEGRTVEQKRAIVQAITEAVCRTAEVTPNEVRVLIDDYAPENWAIGGRLRTDILSD